MSIRLSASSISVCSKASMVSVATEADDENRDGIDTWMSKQGFSDDDYYYYIEDGVIVELLAGDDELGPL